MLSNAKRDDHVVVISLDRIDDSFLAAALFLDNMFRRGVTVHVLNIEGGRFDAGCERARLAIATILASAQAERQMLGVRVRTAFAGMKADGRRATRHAPYGTRWEKRKGGGGKCYAVQNQRADGPRKGGGATQPGPFHRPDPAASRIRIQGPQPQRQGVRVRRSPEDVHASRRGAGRRYSPGDGLSLTDPSNDSRSFNGRKSGILHGGGYRRSSNVRV